MKKPLRSRMLFGARCSAQNSFSNPFQKYIFLLVFMLSSVGVWGQYSGTGTFTKITSLTDLTDGYYVIAYNNTFAMNNTNAGSFFANTAIAPPANVITDPATSIVWNIATNGSGRSIYNEASAKYVSLAASANAAQAVAALTMDNQRWTFAYAGSVFTISNLAFTTRFLQYNTGSPRFACYLGTQQDITLYKLDTPSCSTPSDPAGTITATAACGSTNLSFSGTAPTGVKYYWQTSATGVDTTYPTTSAYDPANSGTYHVRAKSDVGDCWSAGTVSQSVTVVAALSIATQPINQTVTEGATATFNLVANNAFSYQWQVKIGAAAWTNVSTGTGGTSDTYTTPATTAAMNGYQYKVIVTGTSPCTPLESTPRTLTVNAPLPAPVVSPASSNGTVGVAFSQNITATNSPTSYAAGTLPAGLTLNTTTGVISGTPTTAGFFTVAVTASNGTTSAPVNFNFTIAKGTQDLTVSAITIGLPGTAVLAGYITNSSGLTAYTYVVVNPAIATESGGTLTAVAAGSTTIAVTATATANYNAGSGTLTATVTSISYPNNSFLSISGTGGYTTASTWSKCLNGSGCTGTTFGSGGWSALGANGSPSASSDVFVQGNITLTTALGVTNSTILSGGNLTIGNQHPVSSSMTVKTGGTLNVNGNFNFSSSSATFNLEKESNVILNYVYSNPTTSIWAGVENFDPESTVKITNWNNTVPLFAFVTGNSTITSRLYSGYTALFGNLIIDTALGDNWTVLSGSANFNITHNDFTVKNNNNASTGQQISFYSGNSNTMGVGRDFIINTPSASSVQYQTGGVSPILNIRRDLIKNGSGTGEFRFFGGTSVKGTVNMERNLLINAGVFNLNSVNAAASTYEANLKGNLTVGSNAVLRNGNSNVNSYPASSFNFTGTTSAQQVDVATTVANENIYIYFYVKPNAYVQLVNRDLELGTSSKLTVENGGVFDFGLNGTTALNVMPVSGQISQFFDAQAGSSIKITSPYGITDDALSTTAGNVQTPIAGRSYNPGAIYHYIGKVNQVSGNGLPSLASAKTVIVELANDNLKFWATPLNSVKRFTSSGKLEIRSGTVLDGQNPDIPAENYGRFSDEVDAGATALQSGKLTMTGGRYIVYNNTYPAPNLSGDYSFTGGIIQFDGNNQSIRAPKSYLNTEITGVNVGTPAGNITVLNNGNFTVKNGGEFVINNFSIVGIGNQNVTVENGGLFRTGDGDGFSGNNLTSIQPTIGNIILANGSTVEYSRAGNQTITNAAIASPSDANYQNLIISGSGIKSTAAGIMTVKQMTKLTSATAELLVPTPANAATPNVIYALGGIDNTDGTTGLFHLANDAQLMQSVPNPDNSKAKIQVDKDAKIPVSTFNQYVYWSSPVIGQDYTKIFPGKPTTAQYYIENNDRFGASAGTYILGRGLAVKNPVKEATAPSTLVAEFKGTPYVGDYDYDLVWSNAAHGYNLIGNPYPSNLDLNELYTSSSNIESTFRFWDNYANSISGQQGSTYNGYAYAKYNAASKLGIKATGSAGNGNGDPTSLSGLKEPNYILKVGQGFIARATANTAKLSFENSKRITTQAAAEFFGKNKVDSTNNRYWLEMVTPTNLLVSNAIVYFDDGTNEFSADDSKLEGQASDALFTNAGDEKVVINGRSTFADADVVKVGNRYFTSGIYEIRLGKKEGIFENGQNIYLKDRQTGIITDLNAGSYTFSANAGENTGRFEIIYKPETVLATETFALKEILVYRDSDRMVIKSPKTIVEVQLFDATGRLLHFLKPNAKEAIQDITALASGVYLFKIKTADGGLFTRKFIR